MKINSNNKTFVPEPIICNRNFPRKHNQLSYTICVKAEKYKVNRI